MRGRTVCIGLMFLGLGRGAKAPLFHQSVLTAPLGSALSKSTPETTRWTTRPLKTIMRRGLAESFGGGLQERGAIRDRIQQDYDIAALGTGDDVAFEAVFRANSALA